MWLVGIDRPYYPTVEFIPEEQEAKIRYQQLLNELEKGEEGTEKATVFRTNVLESQTFKRNY